MKKIDFLGRRLTIDFEKKEQYKRRHKDIEMSAKNVVQEKILYLILILVLIVVTANISSFKGYLKVDEVTTKDVVAPTDITYISKNAREKAVVDIINNFKKEYIKVDTAEGKTLESVSLFIDKIEENKGVSGDIAYSNVKDTLDVNFSYTLFSYLFEKSDIELNILRDKYIHDITTMYQNKITKGEEGINLEPLFQKLENVDIHEQEFIKTFIKPNYILDEQKSKELLNEKLEQVRVVPVKIPAGTIILKKGETVTQDKVELLEKAGVFGKTNIITKLLGSLLYLLLISILFKNICSKFLFYEIRKRNFYKAITLIIVVGLLSYRFINPSWKYILPIETVFILLGVLINVRTSLIIGSFLILYAIPLNGFSVEYLTIEIFSLITSLYLVTKIKNRTNIINTGIYIGLIKVAVVLISALSNNLGFVDSILKSGMLFLSGAFTGMLTIALLPYFERTFNILTSLKLLELGDLSQPLLRKLSESAPGTFHHSMMVASLSEQATEAIGGNYILARVASYYHDIGKMKRPQFYVENQSSGINPHNSLSPSLSTLIIKSHTKDGDEMGRKHNLPKEIRDIMIEHQGTTLLAYFYNKAKQNNPELEENNFRYSGPKPRSKESAVIMLADSIEAAVRSLDEKTPTTIEKMLRKIIGLKIEQQQLSDADLTFKEIEIIIKTFTKVLMSIHHVRIKYPGQK